MTRTEMIQRLGACFVVHRANRTYRVEDQEKLTAAAYEVLEALKAEEAQAHTTITIAEIASASLPERNSNAANSIANNTIRATQYTPAALTLEDRVAALEKRVQQLGSTLKWVVRTPEVQAELVRSARESGGAQ